MTAFSCHTLNLARRHALTNHVVNPAAAIPLSATTYLYHLHHNRNMNSNKTLF